MSEETPTSQTPARTGIRALLWRARWFWLPPLVLALLLLLLLYWLAGGSGVVAPFVYDLR